MTPDRPRHVQQPQGKVGSTADASPDHSLTFKHPFPTRSSSFQVHLFHSSCARDLTTYHEATVRDILPDAGAREPEAH